MIFSLSAQTKDIRGVVTDESNEPLCGVLIKESGTNNQVITDLEGKFHINVSNNSKIEVVFVGYEKQVLNAQDQMTIRLKEEISSRSKSISTSCSKPVITWYHGADHTAIPQYNFSVRINSSSRIIRYNIILNEAATKGTRKSTQDNGFDMLISESLSLREGKNNIRIEAENQDGVTIYDKTVVYTRPRTRNGIEIKEKRIALVIGNANYNISSNFNRLNSALNDASDMTEKLKALGFEVQTLKDATQSELIDSFRTFCEKASRFDVAVVYYSGHGLQYNKSNYIVPIDVKKMLSEDDIPDYCYNVNTILNRLNNSGCNLKIILLDACRTSFMSKGAGNGLYDMEIASGTVIGYATQPGYPANDGTGRNSPYTKGLLNTLDQPGLNIYNFFGKVKESVRRETGSQNPMSRIEIENGEFYFNPNSVIGIDRNNLDSQLSISAHYDNGILFVDGYSYKMISVVGGLYEMGPTSEMGLPNSNNNSVAHNVVVDDFCIGITEVTQRLWTAIMDYNPSKVRSSSLDYPVTHVSWDDCQLFIDKLNKITGKKFRLPTEAEWEYAARGGKNRKITRYSGSNEIDEVSWFSLNSGKHIHEVATKKPNELGLYDMSGNVAEFCLDWYGKYDIYEMINPRGSSSGTEKICRGGDWSHDEGSSRIATRGHIPPKEPHSGIGFRLVISE